MYSGKWAESVGGDNISFCNWLINTMKWAGLVAVDGRRPCEEFCEVTDRERPPLDRRND